MLEETATALALTGATTVVAAMATDAWQTTRTSVANLFRRSGRHLAIEAQLDEDAALVVQDDDADGARRDLVQAWRRRLAALLRQYPDAAEDLHALVDEVRAALPKTQESLRQTVIARNYGTAFGAVGPNSSVNVHYYAVPGQMRPASPSSDPQEGGGEQP
ncbi:hypothetical protein [Streptomyces bluensis]|uniref:hypothetical protein n=1 Tax=Streptomyces bluensis TaxID=33897 RepID=UPI001677734D|nr:hypothetical protein [Streptomyces bluensis]GGZ80081.1 hypothetical protein GCM10010344_54010 [Streptomyces bluensis]